jgi:hypothetical protein
MKRKNGKKQRQQGRRVSKRPKESLMEHRTLTTVLREKSCNSVGSTVKRKQSRRVRAGTRKRTARMM